MNNILVAYFSATGKTKKVSENLSKATNGTLFEIIPQKTYTDEDLDWTKKTSRNSVEMANPSFRPGILNQVENIDSYKIIFLGFPIWWYREPSIIDTFLEQYDFSGKTIIPFATSGGSNLGNTDKNIQKIANTKVEKGKRFSINATIDELKIWSNQYV